MADTFNYRIDHHGSLVRPAELTAVRAAGDTQALQEAELKAVRDAVAYQRKLRSTVVTDGEKVYVNRTGDSSLSKACTGDVLSGIIGALLGQGMERFDAACASVWIHGRAGELAGHRLSRRSVLARDVIDALPQATAEYESSM